MLKFFFLFFFFSALYTKGCESFIYVGGYHKKLCFQNCYRPPKPLMWSAILKVDRALFLGKEDCFWNWKNRVKFLYGVSIGCLDKQKDRIDKCFVFSSYLAVKLEMNIIENVIGVVFYSPSGPSFLTKKEFSTTKFSNHFVFTDQIGIGLKFKGKRSMEMGMRMYHFSNGDIFPINGGIDVPIMFFFGIYG